jgi:hypothetical protein
MSIEIILHTQAKRREDISRVLKTLGYQPSNHLWEWPTGSMHFAWFEAKDFLSYNGVEATVYKPSEDHHQLGNCLWALHTRTTISASPADKNQQDATIRAIRADFGGNFYNDWRGRNRYTNTSPDGRDAVARGIYLAYSGIHDRLRAVRFATPSLSPQMEKLAADKTFGVLAQTDPNRVLYNALVPFAVATLEAFFSRTFKILLQYDNKAQERLAKQSRKIDMPDVMAIRDGSKSLEDVVADWYSFQNLDSIHSAFSEWLRIDFWKIIRTGKKRKIGNTVALLEERMNQIIQFRHGVVHRMELDATLDKNGIDNIYATTMAVIDAFVDHLEQSRGVPIRE